MTTRITSRRRSGSGGKWLRCRSGNQKPAQRVLAAVDAAQVAVLTAAIQQVRAHRDTLPA